MAAQTIPVAVGVPNSRQRTVLDGREYVLALRWSMREERWYLDLASANGTPLALGIKVVANYPLLASRRFSDALPPGELLANDQRSTPADPGLTELGAVVALQYIPAADMAAGVA
jgi:hypothetical protein